MAVRGTMTHRESTHSVRSDASEPSFAFDVDDTVTHPTLLPNGILNDEEDEVLPWPRKASSDADLRCGTLRTSQLEADCTPREFGGMFTFAKGFLGSEVVDDDGGKVGVARFATVEDAELAKVRLDSLSTRPWAHAQVRSMSSGSIGAPVGSRKSNGIGPTLSSSVKSSGSATSGQQSQQHSRMIGYGREKSNESSGVDDIFGTSLTTASAISSSMPNNYATSASQSTVWSPTSPRFGKDLAKSPPAGLSMLPPPIKEDESWSRGTSSSLPTSRFSGLSIGSAQEMRQAGQSPPMHPMQGPNTMYGSIDNAMRSGGVPTSPVLGNASLNSSAYTAASMYGGPIKHAQLIASNGGFGGGIPSGIGARMGPPAPINTNPADQNPPCNTLYVGNLPLATTEEELKALFSRQPGYRRLCYRTKSNGPMCFVEFEDVNYAINTLKLLQGVILSSSIKGGIRLSFSKNPLGVRKMDNAMLQQGGMPIGAHAGAAHATTDGGGGGQFTTNPMLAPPGFAGGSSTAGAGMLQQQHHHHQQQQQQQHHQLAAGSGISGLSMQQQQQNTAQIWQR